MARSGMCTLGRCFIFSRCRVCQLISRRILLMTVLSALVLSITIIIQYHNNQTCIKYSRKFETGSSLYSDKSTDLDEMDYSRKNDMYLHQPQNLLNDLKLIIFVQSSTTNVKQRQLIRKTWGNISAYSQSLPSGVIFSVGRHELARDIDTEIIKYGDILQLDILDTYYNLTLKGIMTLQWIHQYLPTVEYIFKTDDDILLNIPLLIKILQNIRKINCSCFVVGMVWQNSFVQRTGKYRITKEEYRDDVYPAYCSGSGYLLSQKAVSEILVAAQNVPLMNGEDVFITGVLAALAGIPLFSFNRKLYKITPKELDNIFKSESLVVHGANEELWLNASKSAISDELGIGSPRLNITLTHAPAWHPGITVGKIKHFLKMKNIRSSSCGKHVPAKITLHV